MLVVLIGEDPETFEIAQMDVPEAARWSFQQRAALFSAFGDGVDHRLVSGKSAPVEQVAADRPRDEHAEHHAIAGNRMTAHDVARVIDTQDGAFARLERR